MGEPFLTDEAFEYPEIYDGFISTVPSSNDLWKKVEHAAKTMLKWYWLAQLDLSVSRSIFQ